MNSVRTENATRDVPLGRTLGCAHRVLRLADGRIEA